MCGYFPIGFIDFKLKCKSLLEYTKFFSPSKYEKNEKNCIVCGNYRKFKDPKISYIFEKILALPIIFSKCNNEDKKMFKEEEESIEILYFLIS